MKRTIVAISIHLKSFWWQIYSFDSLFPNIFLKNFLKLSKYVCKEAYDEIISSGNQFTVNKKASRDVAGCR